MTLLFPSGARFLRGNLHTHSTRSDGANAPEEVCRIYRDAGYDFLALTDHFMDQYGFPITDTRPYRRDGFTTLISAELHAPKTELGELWHMTAFGLPDDFAPIAPEETGPDVSRRCVAAGAFVAIVHPAWYGLTEADADTVEAHAVEVYNHTSQILQDRGDGWYLLDQLCAKGRRLSALAVDDAHMHSPDVFGAWVMVAAAENDPDQIIAALKAGQHYSTQGPDLHSIEIDGDDLVIECSPADAVMVLGVGSRAEYELGSGLTRARLPLAKFQESGWCRVTVIDAAGKRGWSNPLTLPTAA
jgi:predicted metal-dependent phosphoesterase TrpH